MSRAIKDSYFQDVPRLHYQKYQEEDASGVTEKKRFKVVGLVDLRQERLTKDFALQFRDYSRNFERSKNYEFVHCDVD